MLATGIGTVKAVFGSLFLVIIAWEAVLLQRRMGTLGGKRGASFVNN